MLRLISYDIVDDTRRRRIFEALKDYGRRVQYSVFECDLTEVEWAELEARLRIETDEREDSVRFYDLCVECAARVRILGLGDRYGEEPYYVL